MSLRTTRIELSEAGRAALDTPCRQQHSSAGSVFGIWDDRDPDAVAMQQALRDEWSPAMWAISR